jgi:hypothetical protein
MRNALWVVALVFMAVSFGTAQVTTGTPPHGSFQFSGVDTVNLANLNIHVDVPVVSKAGRGLPFNYTLNFDSSVWYPATVGSSRVWQPVYNWGWRATSEVALGYVSYRTTTGKCFDGEGGWWYATFYYGYVYHDQFGTPHPLNWGSATCDGDGGDGSATDGSGYLFD